MPTPIDPNKELCDLLDDPSSPFWVQNLVPILLRKDPVDVANAASLLSQILDRRLDALIQNAPEVIDLVVSLEAVGFIPLTFEEEKAHDEFHGVATPSDACREWALNFGAEVPQRPWLLTDYDTWEANPHYLGPKIPHPECQD